MENIKQTNSETDITSASVEKETTQTQPTEQEKIASQFAKYSNLSETQLKNNASFLKDAAVVFNNALSNLPTKKYLVQKFEKGPSNTLYATFVSRAFSDFEWIGAGQGAEYCLSQGNTISTLDPTKFVPDTRNDVDGYTYWDSITIGTEIKQVQLSASPWKYIEYFLSGKVDEYVKIVLEEASKTIKLAQDYECINVLKNIFATTYAKASSTAGALTNHLVGTADNLIEGLAELRNFLFGMYNHNKQFALDSTNFTGYNNMNEGEDVYIVDNETYSALQKVASTFLAKNSLFDFANSDKWIVVPKTIYNPSTKQVEEINFFDDGEGNRVKGAILVVQKSALRRLINLENGYAEFYPNNLTTQHWFNARWITGALKWGQVAVYNNENLEAPFELPVITKTA